jgi:hypothetical protein
LGNGSAAVMTLVTGLDLDGQVAAGGADGPGPAGRASYFDLKK